MLEFIKLFEKGTSMDDSGYVYVLMNPSMPNLVKIGKTTRDPEERAKELSSTTGVPTPFTVVYDGYFQSCTKAEQHIHLVLEEKGFRVSMNREFFEIPIKDAIDAVMQTKDYFGAFEKNDSESNFDDENVEPWLDMLMIAEEYHYGTGDYIQDYNDAIIYYLKAIQLGYVDGYQDIAQIYDYDLEDTKKAFDYYKKGASNGCPKCYAGMGSYYMYQEKDLSKAQKSYELYMKYTPEEELSYLDMCYYIVTTLKEIGIDNKKEDMEYFEKTFPYKDEILKYFSEKDTLFTLYCNYKSFYDLPKQSQEDAIEEYKNHNSTAYITASYSAQIELGEYFLNYLELIYKGNYISPSEYDLPIFAITFTEV